MTNSFDGFPADLFGFLHDLWKNNNRDWFNASKEGYINAVVDPVQAFMEAMRSRLE